MTRFSSVLIALVALTLSAGAAIAFSTMPEAASGGLDTASEMSGKDLPARPAEAPPIDVPPVELPDAVPHSQTQLSAQDLPEAASHGSDVSTVAKGEDPTPDTNRGADVSAAAKDNHGQATAAEKRPENAGPPADPGQPTDAGKPEGAGKPDNPGQPADPGSPDGAGKPGGTPPGP
jgi:hypothetical protein